MPTIAHKEVLPRASLVFALNYLPCAVPAALGTWVLRIFNVFSCRWRHCRL